MGATEKQEVGGWRIEMKVKMNPTSLPELELEGERLLIHFLCHLCLPLHSLHWVSKWKVIECEQKRAAVKANRPAFPNSGSSVSHRARNRPRPPAGDRYINVRSHCRCKAAGGWWLIGRSGSLAPFLQCAELLMWNSGSIRKVRWIQKQSSLITTPPAQGEFPISIWALVSLPPISQHAMFVFSLTHLSNFGPAQLQKCLRVYFISTAGGEVRMRMVLQDSWHNFKLIWLPMAKLMTQVINVPIKRTQRKTQRWLCDFLTSI